MLREGQGRQIEKKVKSWAFAVKSSALIECLSGSAVSLTLSCFVYNLGDLQENIKSSQILAGEHFLLFICVFSPFLVTFGGNKGRKAHNGRREEEGKHRGKNKTFGHNTKQLKLHFSVVRKCFV